MHLKTASIPNFICLISEKSLTLLYSLRLHLSNQAGSRARQRLPRKRASSIQTLETALWTNTSINMMMCDGSFSASSGMFLLPFDTNEYHNNNLCVKSHSYLAFVVISHLCYGSRKYLISSRARRRNPLGIVGDRKLVGGSFQSSTDQVISGRL